MSVEQSVYVGLGSNLEGPRAQVTRAIHALARMADSRLLRRSSLYRTPPLGPADQPDFVNAVAQLTTRLSPAQVLANLHAIETEQGRTRDGPRWGPRTLDLDLLVYGGRIFSENGLTLPHPGIAERAFVLAPLREIDAQLEIPGLGTVDALWRALGAPSPPKLDPPW